MSDTKLREIGSRVDDAKKRMGWNEELNGEPTRLEYLRYYKHGVIGEIHIEAVLDEWVNDVIGADEPEAVRTGAPEHRWTVGDDRRVTRNVLRAEQRRKAGL